MTLEDEIAQRSREIKTDGYSMSIGEVISLYKEGDLDIHPEFQRVFRWRASQKSALIESILLGIPIPSIFVSQRPDGIWDVIDGVQRLSTVLEFMGLYKDADGKIDEPSVLESTVYLPALEGYTWDGGADGKQLSLSETLRRDIKRSKLDFRIIKKESDPNAKYDLFERLNSGSALSPQEARDCLLVMLNPRLFARMLGLAGSGHFVNCVILSESKQERAYPRELVLRFFSHLAYDGPGGELAAEHGEWLTSWMRNNAERDDTVVDRIFSETVFKETFALLDGALGEDAFRRWDGLRHLGPFSISGYEFITAGVAANVDRWRDRPLAELAETVRQIWSEPTFKDNSGTGVSPRRRVPRMVVNARTYFA